MIHFILRGLIRDRQRSLLPVLVVVIGVFLTVFLHCWITGILGDMVDFNARFVTGHVKVVTKAYSERMDQMPNDLALTGSDRLIRDLSGQFPEMEWISRIRFGGMIGSAKPVGTKYTMGPAVGWGIDFLSPNSREAQRMNIPGSIVRGSLPKEPGEVLLSEQFARKLGAGPGDRIDLAGSTMAGALALYDFRVVGTVRFGTSVIDKGAIVADIGDIRQALGMENCTGEVLGYFKTGFYDDEKASQMVSRYMQAAHGTDPMVPVMISLRNQNGLSSWVDYMGFVSGIVIFVFILAMSLVLWNAGLLGGLRRYGEVGVRLAMGESKGHVYRSLLSESILIGIAGSVIGTAVGLALSFTLQNKGLDISKFMQNASMMLPAVFRAHVTPAAFYVGFIPGLFATVLGTALAGIGIYKRKTAQLFKELE